MMKILPPVEEAAPVPASVEAASPTTPYQREWSYGRMILGGFVIAVGIFVGMIVALFIGLATGWMAFC